VPTAFEGCAKDWFQGLTYRTNLEDAIRQAADPAPLMKRIADEAMNLVEGIDGVLVGIVREPDWVSFECGAGKSERHVGKRVPVAGSLSGLALRTGEPARSNDASHDPCVDLEFTKDTGAESIVCVPIWRHDETVGVLWVASLHSGAFDDGDMATLTSLAEFISLSIAVAFDLSGVAEALLSQVARDRQAGSPPQGADAEAEARFVANVLRPGTISRIESRNRIDRFLEGRGLTHAFQPIFDITSGECFAVEALARFSGVPPRPADLWFAEAHELGVGVELELTSVKGALECLDRLPPKIDLCINAGPAAIASGELRQLVKASDPGRIIVELTEQVKVDDYPRLSSAIDDLYAIGVRLAIDDTGAGFASLAHILKLVPSLIKLDRELTSGIDVDFVRITLAKALVSFADGLGAEIVAEGIETAAELEVLGDLGIRCGQGFYLCRPTSLDSIPTRLRDDLMPSRETTRYPPLRQLVGLPARR